MPTPSRVRRRVRRLAALASAAAIVAGLAACGDSTPSTTASDRSQTIRLLTHDSFAVSDGVLAAFTKDTGIKVKLIQGGDAGTVVNQAILTKGNPQADVLFGIDSTFLTRALDEHLFVPYAAQGVAAIDAALQLDPVEHRVTPIDYGDVCLNYDKSYFADHHLDVPSSLDQLVDPAYRDLLVVENPATSSPGLAFLLASVAQYGADGWQAWWRKLDDNGVKVVDGWEQAYNAEFSGGGESQGTRPLVVSYGSSPPAEVIYADPPIDAAPTGVIDATCFRQIEGAGVLAGTKHEAAARKLVDFLLSPKFQADMPLSMFVYPVVPDVALPDAFVKFAATPAHVLSVPAADIGAHRDEWIGQWTDLVRR